MPHQYTCDSVEPRNQKEQRSACKIASHSPISKIHTCYKGETCFNFLVRRSYTCITISNREITYVAQSIGSNLCENLLISLFIGSMVAESAWNCDCFLLKVVLALSCFIFVSEGLAEEFLPPDRISPMKRRSSSICRTPFSETCELLDSIDAKKFS